MENEINFDNTEILSIEMNSINDDVCFGTYEEIEQFEKEQSVLYEMRRPKLKEMKIPQVRSVPFKSKSVGILVTGIESVKAPTSKVPRKREPWAK